jgi:hypothetical protein
MGFPTNVQLIHREDSQQWYINFPPAIAQAMEYTRGEIVEWIIEDKNRLLAPPPYRFHGGSKKNQTQQGVMAGWNALFDQARAAFSQQRSWERATARSVRLDLFGAPHAVRLALCCRTTVLRLVRGLSPL